jgi:regulatory protein
MQTEREQNFLFKQQLIKLLARREYSRAELVDKIQPQNPEQSKLLKNILDDFEDKGVISDVRVIESVVRRLSPKWGIIRIQQEFSKKGVALDKTEIVCRQLQETEVERAYSIWQRKFQLPATLKEKTKQIRFLSHRGFSLETIKALFKQIEAEKSITIGN